MIDLSYLSKEEQEVILAVLKRDAALKKAEEQRVKQLHKTMRDKSKLKYMSGEWFYETKSLRHGDRIHGSDIIRASMRQRKPMTILELSQIWAEKSSFVNSENKDVFVPPELSGLIEEQPAETKTKREVIDHLPDVHQETLKPAVPLQTKQRQNPFNTEPPDLELLNDTVNQLTNGAMKSDQTPAEGFLPPSESCITSHTNPNTDSPDTSPSTKNITKPVPRKRLLLYSSQNSLLDNTDPADRQRSSVIPRGILKHSSSSSSSGDSFPLRSPLSSPLSPQSPKSPSAEYGSLSWLDRKQVRFSPAINASDTAVLQDGRELGEHGLLDQESSSSTFSDQGEEEDTLNTITTGNGVNNSQSYGQDTKECPGSEAQGRHLTSPSCSSPMWNSKPTDRQREEKLDMFLGCRQTEMRGCDESRTQKPIDQHDYHADPHADQVSSLHASAEEKGKIIHKRAGSQSHMLTSEEGHSIAKVLEWFGRGSGQSCGQGRIPNLQQEEKSKEELDSLEVSDTKSTDDLDSTKPQALAKPSPKPRRRLLALFSKPEMKEKSPQVLTPENDPLFQPDGEKDDVTQLCQDPHSALSQDIDRQNVVAEVKEINEVPEILNSKPQTEIIGLDEYTDKEDQQNESNDQGERSPRRLANLKSFWERGNQGPRILIIKTSADAKDIEVQEEANSKNDGLIQKIRESDERQQPIKFHEETTSLKNNSLEDNGTQEVISESSPAVTHCKTSCEVDLSVIPSENKMYLPRIIANQVSSEMQQKFSSGAIPILPVKQRQKEQTNQQEKEPISVHVSSHMQSTDKEKDRNTPAPSGRSSSTPQTDGASIISNMKSYWEKENNGPKIIFSSPQLTPDIKDSQESSQRREFIQFSESQLDFRTSRSETGSLFGWSSSLNREEGSLRESKESNVVEQSPVKVQVGSFGRDSRENPLTQYDPVQMKMQSDSSKSRSLPSPLRYHSRKEQQPTDTKQQVDYPKVPITRHHPKVPKKASLDGKESKKDHSPLRTFAIDISSSKEVSDDMVEHRGPKRDKKGSRYGGVIFGFGSSKVHADKKGKSEGPERVSLTALRRHSEQTSKSKHTLSQSPTRPQNKSAKQTSVGTTQERQSSPHSSSAVQVRGQTVGRPVTFLDHPRRSSDGGWSGRPIVLKERKLSEDYQSRSRLAGSLIPLSYHHYLGLPEKTHIPMFPDRAERIEWIRAKLKQGSAQEFQGTVSRESSPSRHSQPDSFTFDSSRSSISEAGSLSLTSSACDSVDTSPVRTTAKQTNIRPMSISKSLEDISALPSREERWKNDPRGELNLSVHDVSAGLSPTACSFLDPEQMKLMSMSVPAFRQQESNGRDSDCTSDSSFQMSTPKRSTSQANLSMSSGMASMSSVSGSVISIYSGDFGNVEVRGTIQFAINYVQKLGEFHIFVVQCKDLAVAEPKRNRSDPYVKSYLLPDKTKLGKRKTCVRKKTLNPSYNEILRYKVGIETLKTQTLNLSVWHNDNFGRNSFLGEVDIDLSEWDFNNTQMSTYPLKGRVPSTPKPHDHRGEMRVALRFVPQTHSKGSAKSGEVQIWVKDCKNLPIVRGVAIDPFVKCTVLPDTSRKSRQKTRVVKRTANPVFNHTMVYDGFRPEDLREACVELTVWDHDRLSNHFLGGLRLGLGLGTSYGAEVDWMDSNATEAALWERMTEYQNEWVEDWLPLRMLIMARSMSR